MKLYQDHNISNITVQDICLEANLHRSTFYSYFNNVDDLLRSIEDSIIDNLFQMRPSKKKLIYKSHSEYDKNDNYHNQIVDTMYNILVYMQDNIEYILPLLSPYKDQYFRIRYGKIIQEDIKKRLQLSDATFGKSEDYIIHYMSHGVVEMTYKWLKEKTISIDEMSDICMRFFFQNPFIVKK